MPFGRGELERSVIEVLNNSDRALTVVEVAALAYGLPPDQEGRLLASPAHIANAQLVLSRLARKDLATNLGLGPDRSARWASLRTGLRCQLRTARESGSRQDVERLLERARTLGIDLDD